MTTITIKDDDNFTVNVPDHWKYSYSDTLDIVGEKGGLTRHRLHIFVDEFTGQQTRIFGNKKVIRLDRGVLPDPCPKTIEMLKEHQIQIDAEQGE